MSPQAAIALLTLHAEQMQQILALRQQVAERDQRIVELEAAAAEKIKASKL